MAPRQNHDAVDGTKSVNPTHKNRKFDRDWVLNLISRHPNGTTPPEFQHRVLCVAPMVDQSDLPFRLLCRKYGANLCFTPMIHARLFSERPLYRKQFFDLVRGTPKHDRPLIVQLCGSQPEYVIETAKLIEPFCDGIDLNCGCPQGIARRGQYGAFLLEQPKVLIPLVREISAALQIPVSVKVRLLPTGVEDSLELYQKLVEAGASMITIHGRNRLQKAELTGHADWDAIRRAVERLDVPVLANGSMSCLEEIRQCLVHTEADGVMCSEALLEYPPIFVESLSKDGKRVGPGRLQLAREYLALAQDYPPDQGGQGSGIKCIRAHLHRFLHDDLQHHREIREWMVNAESVDEFTQLLDRLEEIHTMSNHCVGEERLSWYVRHRELDSVTGRPAIEMKKERDGYRPSLEVEDECMGCLFDDDDDDDDEGGY